MLKATWLRQEHPILLMCIEDEDPLCAARYLIGRIHCLTQDYSKVQSEEFLCRKDSCVAGMNPAIKFSGRDPYPHDGFQQGDFISVTGPTNILYECFVSLTFPLPKTQTNVYDQRTDTIMGAGKRWISLEEVGGEYWRYLKDNEEA